MNTKRKYAIIGCGMMGREHMQNIALVDDAELVAIVDPDAGSRDEAKALGETLGQDFALFDNADTLFADAIPDAVVIASPNFTHFEVAKHAMTYDVAILLEKPFCTEMDDAAALEQLARDYPHTFWVGMEYRYMPPITRFIERVQSGETGPAKMLYIREHRFPFLEKVGDWNRFNRNTGGTLVEKCCHFFDLMRHTLQDEPIRIFASGGQDVNHLDESYDGEVPDILDNAYVIADFAKGTRAVLDLCMFAEGAEQQEEIYALGPVGRLDVAIPAATVTWSPRDKSGVAIENVATPSDALAAGDHHGATYFQLRDFHAALVNGAAPKVSAVDGLRAVQMGSAAQQSIMTGLPVQLDFKSGGVGNG
ncbi:Gfo/Idh/MocA family oxidoreductase [Pontixanthobacter aestiaquae]|uniref:Gfo/Idh/MocA family oxidoreductase n=1 Tax=Pontixanthobacter aestiaquae TaxID=1509367 RepID=A0A844Z7K8_9SPHN|nr:Gfo/Idh/MocA family oxidoreductase [Pontixanthobacter aestiaquae]MDN3646218.1 Gfo/Idh/MocA family oxidoreductase [Pontixanthobacter aestiaquae]MXO82790.1 gfo/Idh/MocA family oxidoreductase [Pontixanthobacter aestiaquae]